MFTEIIIISLLGGLVCLDRVFIQAMISRPIVVAPFIGILLGDPQTGLLIGALIELFWIDRVPVGTYIPPNDTIAAILAVAISIIAGKKLGGVSPELIAGAILIAIPFGILAKKLEILMAMANDAVSNEALEDAKAGDIRSIERKVYFGLIKVFFAVVIFLLLVQILFIPLVIWLNPLLPTAINKALSYVYYFLPLIGIAVAINTVKLRGAIPIFCAVFLLLIILTDILHVF